ncbi:MAG TPA: hypothetical protein ENN41_02880 [Sediminispirochaeta sp.]|nr:hypothetical protein [Sediminispirochaeta sp.]
MSSWLVHIRKNLLKRKLPSSAPFFAAVLFVSCGIPSYPYLWPPEKIPNEIGFTHDERNAADVFVGYEIYYRIYTDGVTEERILEDKEGFSSFSSVSGDNAHPFNYPYIRLAVFDDCKELGLDVPHIEVPEELREVNFKVVFTESTDQNISYLDIRLSDPNDDSPPSEYRGYRNTANSEDIEDYTDGFSLSEFSIDDPDVSDVSDDFTNNNQGVQIAFFAVPYGMDSVILTPIYANGTGEDMVLIGVLDASQ